MEKKTRKNLPLSKVLHDNIDDYRNDIDFIDVIDSQLNTMAIMIFGK